MKGAWGEKAAAEWLISRGWHILERNYRTRFGELDIIAENERFLVFFEVKRAGTPGLRRPVRR